MALDELKEKPRLKYLNDGEKWKNQLVFYFIEFVFIGSFRRFRFDGFESSKKYDR